jgi:hypothetical protein
MMQLQHSEPGAVFRPSIARDFGRGSLADAQSGQGPSRPCPRAAVWAFGVSMCAWAAFTPTGMAAVPPAVVPPMLSSPLGPETSGVPQDGCVAATTQEMVAALKQGGLPIAAISDVLDVERKTVYSWLDNGVEANPANYDRLRTVHALLSGEAPGALRLFHRFWTRAMPAGNSLKEVLTASEIDPRAVCAALDALRPAVTRAMVAERDRKTLPENSPAASLTLNLQAMG